MVEGFDHVPFNNMNAVRDAIGPATAGIIVEPIQGEGGVRPADMQFLRDLRAACDEYGLMLGMDEVQSGMGRTGKLFAHEWAGIAPDVMSAARASAAASRSAPCWPRTNSPSTLSPARTARRSAAILWPAPRATR